jgi:hypothetical protein
VIVARVLLVAAFVGSFIGMALVLFEGDLEDSVGPRLSVVGPPEVVFNWDRDRCDDQDIPDSPARAFVDSAGRVDLVDSTSVTRLMTGTSLDHPQHSCQVAMASGSDSRPEQFNDREWITAPYSPDGRTVFALVHNEYQGHLHPGRCRSGDYFKCWFNAITYAVSTDGGHTFRDGKTPPNHLVASVPYRYKADTGPYGLFQPSNIVRRKDGYFYVLIRAHEYGAQKRGACLMRTRTLADPKSWRAWDGRAFTVSFINPYRDSRDVAVHICEPVSVTQIDVMTQSLTFNTYLDRYVLVGESGKPDPRRRSVVWGVYFSTSKDLIHWSERQLVMETELAHTFRCGDRDPLVHPSVLDPASTSRNFETVGKTAYLYLTQIKYSQDKASCEHTFHRDLIRRRIVFSR